MADTTDKTVTGGGDAGSAATATAVAASEANAGASTQNADPNTNTEAGTSNANAGAGGSGDGGGEGGQGQVGEGGQPSGAAATVPESYDLTLEGELAEPGVREGLEGSFRDAGMTQEAASKFVGGFIPKLVQHQKAKAEAWKSDMDETLRADPEFVGKDGKGYDASVEFRDLAIEKMGGPKLLEWMKSSGLINQPGLAKAFRSVGEKFLAEDKIVTGGGKGNSKPRGENVTFEEAGQVLYPS